MAHDRNSLDPERFVADTEDSIEAIVIRIGAGDAQLVLVDHDGRWDRWVYGSVDECKAVAEKLGIAEVHVGEYPEKTRVRMNARLRPAEEYDHAAYPEQGRVGPVKPYPENRPRSQTPLPEEAPVPRGD